MGKYQFTVRGNQTYLNDKPFLVRGLRCSNGLYSEWEFRILVIFFLTNSFTG